MFSVYLTPASIAYLTEFILSLAVTLYLLNRLRSQRTHLLFLVIAFFAPMTAFTGLLIFNASLLPFPRILTVYAENATLGLALAALNAFAYNFPERYPQHKWEMHIALALSLSYFFWEVGFMVFRYVSIFTQGNIFIRPAFVAYSIPIIILFAPVAFVRQSLAADPRPMAWWRRLWKPEGKGARGARNFALILCIPVVLGIVNALVFFGLSLMIIHAIISIGILIMLWMLAINYINFIPGSVDVASRLSILMLTLFLSLLGVVGWLISPHYIATYHPDLHDHQTLRFTPNATGGYDVSEVDFHFERPLGKVNAQTQDENGNQQVEFAFPFYGETHTEAYVNRSGIISLGRSFRTLNLQSDALRVPALFPLAISLTSDPAEEDSGLYINREAERLIVTWNRMLATAQLETRYTFQTILYADGTFEFTYNGLPQTILFKPNNSPSDNPLLSGVAAGHREPLYEFPAGMEQPADLVAISHAGASPLLQNHLLAFRRYLHAFMLPIAWVVVGGSLLILLIIPLLLRSTIARPLKALTDGVRRMGAGEMDIVIPVQTADEIGFLTGAFNKMGVALDDHVRNLETRVAEHTSELEEANARLRASETSIRSLIENVKDVFARYDLDLRFQYISPMVLKFMDVAPESFIGKTHREVGFPEDKAEFFDASLRKVIETKTPIDVEFSLQVRDGETIQQTRVYPELNEYGEVTSVVTVTSDITERKMAEKAFKESEARFRESLEFSPTPIALADHTGKLIFLNQNFIDTYGYTLQDIPTIDQWMLQAYPDTKYRNLYLQQWGQDTEYAVKNNTVTSLREYQVTCKSGEVKTAAISAYFEKDLIVGHFYDVTERKRAEESLRESEAKYRLIFESMARGVVYQDAEGKIISANPAAEKILGLTLHQMEGRTSVDPRWRAIHEDGSDFPGENHPSMRALHEGIHVLNVVMGIFNPQTSNYRWLNINAVPQFREGETIPYQVYTTFDDISERKEAEEKLRQAQARIMEQQRAVAAFEERERLAHELHDGIGQALGYINMETDAARELLRQGNKKSASDMMARLAEAARETHESLRGYIHNLTSATSTPREDFFSALERYCQHLREAYLFDVMLVFPQDRPADVLGSAKIETHLTYIIREALSNARRYSGQRRATVTIDFDDETVQAMIADQGVGMNNQYASTDRRTRERFGLRIMRERADDAGGILVIESEAGKGTRVIARLPRDISSASLSGLRILLVDDHPLFSNGLRNVLMARGAQVVGMVKDSAEAQGAAQALNPDVILMDIRMPRMNGIEATRQIKANLPEMKVVMLTTSLSEAELFESLRAGASGFLSKSMSADALIAALGNLVRGEVKFSAELAQKILAEFPLLDETREPKATSEPSVDSNVLSHRQMEILRLVANGLTYKEIGRQLYLTERTVKYHMGEILARLQLKGRREVEEYAKRNGVM